MSWPYGIPWPILLEKAIVALRDGDFGTAMDALDRLVVIRGDEYRFFAPRLDVLDRVFINQQVYLGEQVSSVVTQHYGTDRREEPRLCALLGRLPVSTQEHLLSPDPTRPICLAEVLRRLDVLNSASLPPINLINGLPNEILIEIGRLLFDALANSVRDTDLARVALTAVCRRWSSVFSTAEFWEEAHIGPEPWYASSTQKVPSSPGLGIRAGQKMEAFLSRGGVKKLVSTWANTPEESLPMLEALQGRAASLRKWSLSLPRDIPLEKIWDIWVEPEDFNLDEMTVSGRWPYNDAPWTFPARLDFRSITRLHIEAHPVHLLPLSISLPSLRVLKLDDGDLRDPGGTSERPLVILFAELLTLEIEEINLEFDYPATSFDLPALQTLSITRSNDLDVCPFVRPQPHPPLSQLRTLSITYMDMKDDFDDDKLCSIFRRHPSLLDVSLQVDGTSLEIFDALGRDACPALTSLRLINWAHPISGATVNAMLRSREEAAARGEEIFPFSLELEGDETWDFSEEEDKWHSAYFERHCQ